MIETESVVSFERSETRSQANVSFWVSFVGKGLLRLRRLIHVADATLGGDYRL